MVRGALVVFLALGQACAAGSSDAGFEIAPPPPPRPARREPDVRVTVGSCVRGRVVSPRAGLRRIVDRPQTRIKRRARVYYYVYQPGWQARSRLYLPLRDLGRQATPCVQKLADQGLVTRHGSVEARFQITARGRVANLVSSGASGPGQAAQCLLDALASLRVGGGTAIAGVHVRARYYVTTVAQRPQLTYTYHAAERPAASCHPVPREPLRTAIPALRRCYRKVRFDERNLSARVLIELDRSAVVPSVITLPQEWRSGDGRAVDLAELERCIEAAVRNVYMPEPATCTVLFEPGDGVDRAPVGPRVEVERGFVRVNGKVVVDTFGDDSAPLPPASAQAIYRAIGHGQALITVRAHPSVTARAVHRVIEPLARNATVRYARRLGLTRHWLVVNPAGTPNLGCRLFGNTPELLVDAKGFVLRFDGRSVQVPAVHGEHDFAALKAQLLSLGRRARRADLAIEASDAPYRIVLRALEAALAAGFADAQLTSDS